MVSTRSHPTAFPPADLTSPRKSSRSVTPSIPPSTPGAVARKPTTTKGVSGWAHTPSNLTLIWLWISLPLVIWDTLYVFLRPHSMPGGSLHAPVWQPYALYGAVDHMYGFPAWEARNGFTAAQAALNAVETALYAVYLGVVVRSGGQTAREGTGAPGKGIAGWWGASREVRGSEAGKAVVVGFTAAVMTLSKTVLYFLNEYFSGYESVGHNDFITLLFVWIIPMGSWIVLPAYMSYVFGKEIVQGLDVAAGAASEKLE